jgi:hypothetical protein
VRKLRFEIHQAPRFVYARHCLDCLRTTSSAFSLAIVVPDATLFLWGAESRLILRATDSGRVANLWVCADCGSWIYFGPTPGDAPIGINRNVRSGTLDDTSWLRPMIHFYVKPALRNPTS